MSMQTATQIIRQLKALPMGERRKVFAYVATELSRREGAADRKAVEEARRDPRPPTPWPEAKKRIGLASKKPISLADAMGDLVGSPAVCSARCCWSPSQRRRRGAQRSTRGVNQSSR